MPEDLNVQRRRAAEAARAYIEERLSWQNFIDEFGKSEDRLIGVLVDVIEHEPKRGGFLGANEKEWAEYQAEVLSAIVALEAYSM